MSKYDSWSKDDLVWKCCELEDRIEKLEVKLRKCESEKYNLIGDLIDINSIINTKIGN